MSVSSGFFVVFPVLNGEFFYWPVKIKQNKNEYIFAKNPPDASI